MRYVWIQKPLVILLIFLTVELSCSNWAAVIRKWYWTLEKKILLLYLKALRIQTNEYWGIISSMTIKL